MGAFQVFLGISVIWVGFAQTALASEGAERQWLSAKEDYITCWKQPCVYAAGGRWSEENPNGVAVSVRMGTKPVVTDDQIKTVIADDFAHFGVTNLKFFFEQNDAKATGISFHIRGGTKGRFLVTEARDQIEALARFAKNDNPLFLPSD